MAFTIVAASSFLILSSPLSTTSPGSWISDTPVATSTIASISSSTDTRPLPRKLQVSHADCNYIICEPASCPVGSGDDTCYQYCTQIVDLHWCNNRECIEISLQVYGCTFQATSSTSTHGTGTTTTVKLPTTTAKASQQQVDRWMWIVAAIAAAGFIVVVIIIALIAKCMRRVRRTKTLQPIVPEAMVEPLDMPYVPTQLRIHSREIEGGVPSSLPGFLSQTMPTEEEPIGALSPQQSASQMLTSPRQSTEVAYSRGWRSSAVSRTVPDLSSREDRENFPEQEEDETYSGG